MDAHVTVATVALDRTSAGLAADLDRKLDQALMDTFPASDPVSMLQPAPHDAVRPAAVPDNDTGGARRYATLPHFALHPPIHLRGRESVRSLDEAAEAVHRQVATCTDERSEHVLRRLVEAASPEEAEKAGMLFRTWAKECGILIVPPEDH
jgi:hypothetical protein